MATGRVTLVRSQAAESSLGRVVAVRSQAVSGYTGRVVTIRSRAVSAAPVNGTVEPFDPVDLGAGTWAQTAGPTVTPPVFNAPATQYGTTLTFTSGGDTATITVKPHTMFRITSGGLVGYQTITLGVDPSYIPV